MLTLHCLGVSVLNLNRQENYSKIQRTSRTTFVCTTFLNIAKTNEIKTNFQFTGTATEPQRNRSFRQFNNDQYCTRIEAVMRLHSHAPPTELNIECQITDWNVQVSTTLWRASKKRNIEALEPGRRCFKRIFSKYRKKHTFLPKFRKMYFWTFVMKKLNCQIKTSIYQPNQAFFRPLT